MPSPSSSTGAASASAGGMAGLLGLVMGHLVFGLVVALVYRALAQTIIARTQQAARTLLMIRAMIFDLDGMLVQTERLKAMSYAPASFDAEAQREEKVKLLKAVRLIRTDEVAANTVRAQYRGYRDEPGIAADSQTETYAAVRFFIDNWRWQGVPFYLRSGKRLAVAGSDPGGIAFAGR